MSLYAKYEFPPDQLPEELDPEYTGDLKIDGTYAILGHLVKDPAVMSEDGETVITPAVISDKIAVDVLWNNKANARAPWQVNRVLPKKHLNWIFGMEFYYENKGV